MLIPTSEFSHSMSPLIAFFLTACCIFFFLLKSNNFFLILPGHCEWSVVLAGRNTGQTQTPMEISAHCFQPQQRFLQFSPCMFTSRIGQRFGQISYLDSDFSSLALSSFGGFSPNFPAGVMAPNCLLILLANKTVNFYKFFRMVSIRACLQDKSLQKTENSSGAILFFKC